jgi:hypothetical protein
MKSIRILSWFPVIAILASVVTACSPVIDPFEEADLLGPIAKSISDGNHGGGNEHFFFLPPMVAMPPDTGIFDGGLSPVIKIYALSEGLPVGPPIAVFTIEPGSGSETVRVSAEDGHYIVNWHTKRFDLDESLDYRIVIFENETELGFADVDVVASGKDQKYISGEDYVPLKYGRTLPIKFRIAEDTAIPPEPVE